MTTAKKTKTSTAKKTASKAKPSRREQIEQVLARSKEPRTNQEICKLLHLPKADAKFVASIMIGEKKKKKVTAKKKACPITGRTVTAWTLRRGA